MNLKLAKSIEIFGEKYGSFQYNILLPHHHLHHRFAFFKKTFFLHKKERVETPSFKVCSSKFKRI